MSLKWYIIHTTPSYENKVKERIFDKIKQNLMEDKIGEILIPSEEVVELKNGKKITSLRRLFPGYIFAQIAMDDVMWHMIKKISNVTGFVSSNGAKPSPMRESEINSILDRINKTHQKPAPKILFEAGEMVRVKDGPFKDFTANITSVDYDRAKLKISVTVFGRETGIDISFSDVEKVL